MRSDGNVKPCGLCHDLYESKETKTCPLCDRVLGKKPNEKQVWLCVTVDKHYKQHVIKLVESYEDARKWRHERVDKIIEMEKLQAKYYLSIGKRTGSKNYSKWSNFAKENNLFMYEERHSPYNYPMYMNIELGVNRND